ncbi:MAG: hypothetical protein E7596_02050 [Ruminococcaceae bacterium]|nr:hypothetical protein [Oscillospiraceae bacterium]
MNRRITLTAENFKITHFLLFFVILYFFCGLWYELPFANPVYSACTFALVAWVILKIVSNIEKFMTTENVVLYVCIAVWCVLMFLVYNFAVKTKTVSFFGLRMDQHALIMIYYAILLIPGVVLRDDCRVKIGKLFKFLLAFIIISSLAFTLYAVAVYPDALRARATAEQLGYEDIMFGLPTYSMIYSMALFFPWLLMKARRSSGFEKLFYLGLGACLVVTVAFSQFATALIALIVGFVVYFVVVSRNKPLRSILLVAVVIAFFAVGMETWGDMLIDLADDMEGSWADKLAEIGEFLKGNEATGDLETRFDYYKDSFNSFLKSPIAGMLSVGKTEIGGHATLVDMLALVGIFGTVPFIIIVGMTIKKLRKMSNDLSCTAAVWGTITIFIIFLVMKNIISAISISYSFFVLIPILFGSEVENEHN